jgi:hypothetical protein
MARSPILTPSTDLVSDNGAVLWSLVQGEQLELPVELDFLTIATSLYAYEAVLMEADNVQEGIPIIAKPGGVNSTLNVRVPVYTGLWASATAYFAEQVVMYNNLYYRLLGGTARVNALAPDLDTAWVIHKPNTVYVQFTEGLTLIPAWTIVPTPDAPIYGYFELSVKEPAGGTFRRTWKPLRGVVSFSYSPTALV